MTDQYPDADFFRDCLNRVPNCVTSPETANRLVARFENALRVMRTMTDETPARPRIVLPDQAEMEAKAKKFASDPHRPCILCGAVGLYTVGAFIPDDPWEYDARAAAPGNLRVLFYGFCKPCHERGEVARDEAEAKLRPCSRCSSGPAGRAEPGAPDRED